MSDTQSTIALKIQNIRIEYSDFERQVTDWLIRKAKVTNSDAQGIVEANERIVSFGYLTQKKADKVADEILQNFIL